MVRPIRVQFARLCRETRTMLDITQRELAEATGVSRSLIAEIESGRANPSLDVVTRIGDAFGLELELAGRPPIALGTRTRDAVHARCSGYVDRRLRAAGWQTRREVEVVGGRSHGWIDLLAFDPRTGALLIVEVKTWLDDLGAIERQLAWYERSALEVGRQFDWQPRTVTSWLLLLASDEVEDGLRRYRDLIRIAFPRRAAEMRIDVLQPERLAVSPRGLALIDPTSRRRDWLLPSRSEGRRTQAPYRDYADAARRLAS
ncbi:MAG TPA: helix-turn-helix domain-containing protein [Candidatus Limnocylindrales bacterium]|nr:helix-turn-helix domain-containing protein [Candidatus Limnocylindrales bacterium]